MSELQEAKKEIGNDPKKFAKYASQYSQCKSKFKGGSLGSIAHGNKLAIYPSFDKAAFDPKNVGKVVGPIKTAAGSHLILVSKLETPKNVYLDESKTSYRAKEGTY